PAPSRRAADRSERNRTVVAVMAAGVVRVTLTLGTVVIIHLVSQRTAELSQPFGWFVSGLIVLVYLASIGYAIALPRMRDASRFAALQLAGDVAVITALVHVTGGAESGFASMYILVVVAATVMEFGRHGTLLAVLGCALAYLAVSIAGYLGALPAVIGQPFLPWETTPQSASRAVLLNLVALGATALLAGNLAEQAR